MNTKINTVSPFARISYRDKVANDYAWAKESIKSLIFTNIGAQDKSTMERMVSNYRLFNNILDQRDFEKHCNLLGLKIKDFKDEIKPYNKIPTKVQTLLGEELKRPWPFQTMIMNEDGVRSKILAGDLAIRDYIEGLLKEIESIIEQHLPKAEAQAGPDGQVDPEQQKQLEEQMRQQIDTLLNDYVNADRMRHVRNTNKFFRLEKLSSRLLEYFIQELDIRDISNDTFKHALISGMELAWVDVCDDNIEFKSINPLGFFYDKHADTKWIDEGRYAGYRTYLSQADIIANYGHKMSKKDLDKITGVDPTGIGSGRMSKTMKYEDAWEEIWVGASNNNIGEGQYGYNYNNTDTYEVIHVE